MLTVSDANEDNSVETGKKGHSCDTMAKNLSELCPCPRELGKAKYKDDKLVDELSNQQEFQAPI